MNTTPTVGVVVAVVAPGDVHDLVRHANVLRVSPQVLRSGHGYELHCPLLAERLVRLRETKMEKGGGGGTTG